MPAMAASADVQKIGCTQVKEILISLGVELVADLPLAYELATVFDCSASQCQLSAHMLSLSLSVDDACRPAAQ